MTDAVKQVIATDKDGAKLSPEQLADAGVKPGERGGDRDPPVHEGGLRARSRRGRSRDGRRVSRIAGRRTAGFLTAPRDSGADKRRDGTRSCACTGAQPAKPRCDRRVLGRGRGARRRSR